MPIIFNEETNQFEGENLSGETLQGFDFSVFGGIITNSGLIRGVTMADTAQGIEVTNTLDGVLSKIAGSPFAVDLLGNGGRNFFNDGTIFGAARFGNGWDSFFNSGTVKGQLIMGSGNDLLTNQIIPGIDGGPETIGTITGNVYMGDGNDTVLNSGKLGNVRLGEGNDSYSVGGFGASFGSVGTSGDVRGEGGNDELFGGSSDERFYGGAGEDTLFGGAGKDKLYGNEGADDINGGDGNDYIQGGGGNDFIDGGNQNDRIFAGANNDDVYAGFGNDYVEGGNGSDYIAGEKGNDKLFGESGNDTLEGGEGRDTLNGGDGADVFVFAAKSGRDTIQDFTDGDRIDLFVPFDSSASYSDIIANTSFAGGNAVIDLSAVFNLSGAASIDHGSILTVENVTLADLDEGAFAFLTDILVAV